MSDNRRLEDIAGAVLDGATVDWTTAESDASASMRAVLSELRAIAAIGTVTRSFVGKISTPAVDHSFPRTWGHLRPLETLGRGAFGAVVRAWDTKLDREVALKLLTAGGPTTAAVIEEGRLLARVHHPNVVTIFGADRIDGRAGLWMELVHGDTLEEIVTRDGPLSPNRVRAVARQLLAALGAVHAAGLVHRDVKTQNVMLTNEGRVVLMDFGAGRTADSSSRDIAGTPLYMAPEIFERRPATPQSDIYAAGVVLYRALTGRFPVEGRTMADVRDGHIASRTQRDVRRVQRRVPRRLARAIEKALAADPHGRFVAAQDMAVAIEPVRVSRRILAVAAVIPMMLGGLWLAESLSVNNQRAGPPPRGESPQSAPTADTASARRLDVPADAEYFLAGLSADGRFFSYTARDGSVRQLAVADGSVRTLVKPEREEAAQFVVSSPDGARVAYEWWNTDETYELRLFDTRSGLTRTILSDPQVSVPEPVQWSADGVELLVMERMNSGTRRIVLVDTFMGRIRVVREFTQETPLGLTVSPDRQLVAYDTPTSATAKFRTLHIINSDGTRDREISGGDYSDWSPLWTPDGRGIFFLSDRTGAPDGWFIPVSSGEVVGDAEVVARNLSRTMPLGLISTGAFYYRLQTGAFDVFSVQPSADNVAPHRVTGRFRGSNIGASYSPDGTSVAYISVRDGYGSERDRSIVLRNLASGDERELHPLPSLGVAAPRWSPDGRQLLVRGSSPEHASGMTIWAVDIASGRARHIVSPPSEKDETDIGPMGWDTTGDGAVYERVGRGLVRHSVTTGQEQVLYAYGSRPSHGRIYRFGFSAAGGPRFAFSASREGAPDELVVIDRGIDRTVAAVEPPAGLVFQGWSGDGAWVYYSVVPARPGPHEIWRVAANGGTPQRLPVKIPGAPQINGVSVNPVSGELAYTAGTPTTEVWMMENFLPRQH